MKKMMKKFSWGSFIIGTILVLWGLIIFYPFYNSILVSFMSQAEFMRKPFAFVVDNPNVNAYREILSTPKFLYGYKNVLLMLIIKLPASLIMILAAGYALSRKRFPLSKLINNLIVFTMYFGGGLIPTYLTIKSYGMLDTLWSVIVLGIFSVYDMILVKNYFYGIPDSLEESAKIDGANDLRIFAQIYVPLAKPIVATISLFIAVGIWNTWYNPMIFISDSKKWPLQLVLREIIGTAQASVEESEHAAETREVFALNIQMAAVVVTMLPIMLVYPFLQKYFMSGLTVGAVKG